MPKVKVQKDIEIYYETMGEGKPLILCMGIATQLVHWPPGFLKLLLERGFQIIRFDNRDVGLSSKLEHLGRPNARKNIIKGLLGLPTQAPYTLSDMAGDVVGLMDALGLESAHLAGVSMGGMIAQTVSLEHSQRVRSLTSIMSTTGDRYIGKFKAIRAILTSPGKNREEQIERGLKVFRVLAGDHFPFAPEIVRELVGLAYDRDPGNRGFPRQFAAIVASGSRTKLLRQLKVPTLVIHGAEDPLIPPKAGIATAKAIPGARFELIEGMGHSLPRELWAKLADLIHEHTVAYEPSSEQQPKA
jgi:pimeloyl-ACP methyl ester carboxylesterase